MANKYFRQVLCSERLPIQEGSYIEFLLTDIGILTWRDNSFWDGNNKIEIGDLGVDWWLEEVELPSDEEQHDLAISYSVLDAIEGTASLKCDKKKFEAFKEGFTKAIQLIKGE